MGRTLNQQMGDIHEADIAEWVKGSLQKASGNQWHNPGDVKNGEYLTPLPITGDGKSTMGKSITVSRDMWNKIVEQTFGQTPALFLRFYRPGEQIRTVDLDLAVTRAGFFADVLELARKWSLAEVIMQKTLTDEVTIEDVAGMVDAARKWGEIVETIGEHYHEVNTDLVLDLIRRGREQQEGILRELTQLGEEMEIGPTTVIEPDFSRRIRVLEKDPTGIHPVHMGPEQMVQTYFCPTAEEVETNPGGGFDKCCSAPEYHVPLPSSGYGTEVLTRILSDRLQRQNRVQVSETGCDCCR